MGFDAVWITPVVQQRKGVQCIDVPGQNDEFCQVPYHGYWTEDFYAIDEHFGTPEDLLSLSLALKERGMGLVLDMVVNHVRPIDAYADLAVVRPFDRSEHYNMFGAAPGEDFASYLKHPKVCLPPPGCGLAEHTCEGYNPEQVLSGWFYDLADLNQSHPYVSSELRKWGRHMVNKYQIDAIRLDTVAYVPLGFLRAFREAVGVEIYGEVASSNQTYLESFLRPGAVGGSHRWGVGHEHTKSVPAVDGLYDYNIFRGLKNGFCGDTDVVAIGDSGIGWGDSAGGNDSSRRLSESVGGNGSALNAVKANENAANENGDAAASAGILEPVREEWWSAGNLRIFAQALKQKMAWSSVDQGRFAIFGDTHDEPRLARLCKGDSSRVANALATIFLIQGTPVIFYGTEQGFAQEFNRHSLWHTKYNTSTPQYKLIAKLNKIRKKCDLPSKSMALVDAKHGTLVLRRGPAHASRSVWLFANNRPSNYIGPIRYCPSAMPPDSIAWIDALSGDRAQFVEGCLLAYDSKPKVLVRAE